MITRFRGIQEKVRNSSCKHVDEKSANGLPLVKILPTPVSLITVDFGADSSRSMQLNDFNFAVG